MQTIEGDHEVDALVGEYVLVARVALVDSERVADMAQLLLMTPADRVHIRIGVTLVDRNELRTEAQAYDRDVHLLLLS